MFLKFETPYGEMVITNLFKGTRHKYDFATISGKLNIEEKEYIVTIDVMKEFNTNYWRLRDHTENINFPRIFSTFIQPWNEEKDKIEPSEIEESNRWLNISQLYTISNTIIFKELKYILETPDWKKWLECDKLNFENITNLNKQLFLAS